ncbi:hypothetical protein K439DRAFT_926412 [Ramaria rubella]|nr:hypothetical protein K439DRAFT_926412 [Ramaria rubella]
MITAAYYKGKHNLDSAKKVLEAGIDMAVQIGEESDTKPFWHLLSQINTTLQTRISPLPSTLNASLAGGTSSLSSAINSISSGDTQEHLRSDVKSIQLPSPPKDISNLTISSNNSAHVLSRVQASDLPALDGVCNSAINNSQESSSPPCFKESVSSISQRLTGPSKRETLSNLPPPSLTPPLDHMGSLAKVYTMSLQSEISVLHEKQNAVLEDLSVTRAAKRRAEDEVKEERSVRRKLEKHLRATEDALSRSKRMEDAALDQVRREVEARRKAEALLAEFKANKEQAELSTSGSGQSIFTSENSNNAAVLFHLASMIRGVPSSDRSASLSFGNGGPTASSRRLDDR